MEYSRYEVYHLMWCMVPSCFGGFASNPPNNSTPLLTMHSIQYVSHFCWLFFYSLFCLLLCCLFVCSLLINIPNWLLTCTYSMMYRNSTIELNVMQINEQLCSNIVLTTIDYSDHLSITNHNYFPMNSNRKKNKYLLFQLDALR